MSSDTHHESHGDNKHDEARSEQSRAGDASASDVHGIEATAVTLVDMSGVVYPVGELLARNPAAVYLAALDSGSRRTMRQALNTIATLLGIPVQRDGDGKDVTHLTCPWGALRYAHTSAVRAALAERFAPATANKMLSALRRVLQEAWRLGQLGAEDYARARDVPPITGEVLPAGRALRG